MRDISVKMKWLIVSAIASLSVLIAALAFLPKGAARAVIAAIAALWLIIAGALIVHEYITVPVQDNGTVLFDNGDTVTVTIEK